MPGEANGISSSQYSPPSPAFLYPILSPEGLLSPCFVLLPNFEFINGWLLWDPWGSSKLLRIPLSLCPLGFCRVS